MPNSQLFVLLERIYHHDRCVRPYERLELLEKPRA